MIAVDHDVPVPIGDGIGRIPKYPWASMAVGDSFFVPGKGANDLLGAARPRKLLGEKHTCRTLTENGVKGVRVWRVK